MDFQYNYPITNFPNNLVYIDLLKKEINSKILDLDYIDIDSSICNIYFSRQLLDDEENIILYNIITTHSGLPSKFKIYNYSKSTSINNFLDPPYDLNFNILGLHKKRNFNKGELMNIEYYGIYDPSTKQYSDLVIKEYREYFRINEMVNRRKLKIEWYTEDNSVGTYKDNIMKFYNPQESLRAGEIRRNNIISNLKIATVGLIMQAKQISQRPAADLGELLITDLNSEISQYKEGSETPLEQGIITIDASVHDWIDWVIPNTGGITIRYYLLDQVQIDYTINNVNI